jgi:SAM-dependent methyltransferase
MREGTRTMNAQGQEQVSRAFGYKWLRSAKFGIEGDTVEALASFTLEMLGWPNEAAYAQYLSDKGRILDAGCGNGRETALMARLAPAAEVFGLDISDAVIAARENTAHLPNAKILQADLCSPPLDIGKFNYIAALGVLHHTPNTYVAFRSVIRLLLAPGGEFAFYIYRKKAPIREFTDDLVRKAICDLEPEEAWREMEGITLLGKALSDLKAEIEVPAIKSLGVQAGRHNVQRLIYYTILKCYWRDAWSFEDNVHVNFDWYYPRFAWRHTASDVRRWIAEEGVEEVFFKETTAGLCFRVRKNRCQQEGPS